MMRLIGYGNPGRGDDGLGPALAAKMEDIHDVHVCSDYQLTVDHALLIANARIVVFADALMHSDTPFEFGPVAASTAHDVTSHSLSPQAVLALCKTLYDGAPKAFVMGITGHDFGEVKEGLSPLARGNLELAEAFLRDWFASTHSGRWAIMHEMSLCENIREIILEQAAADGFTRVNRVWLEVGPLSCVEPDALRFGFDVVMRGSIAEGAELEIATHDAKARCLACGRTETITQRYAPCPTCGAGPMEMIQGDALKISKLEVV